MLFNSYAFIFLFLPLCWTGYWCLVKSERFSYGLSFLTLCSLGFYAYWSPIYLALLLASILFNYTMAGIALKTNRKALIYVAVIVNLIVLGYFKYSIFFVELTNNLLETKLSLAEVFLPLGISFFTFHQITYLFDTFNRIIPRVKFRDYTLYIAFFPQLIAGPIVRAREFIPQISNFIGSQHFWKNTVIGFSLFIMGLGKKVIVADYFAIHANNVFNLPIEDLHPSFFDSWVASLSYTFQLYFDFSGYSDMALGLALLFGFKLPINFLSPYQSQNIGEFWRRWHITMSSFFRDYLYIPMGGSHCTKYRQIFNLMLTMGLVGLWHGAGFTFILWGLLHGTYLAMHRIYKWALESLNITLPPSLLYRVISTAVTFLAVVIGWTLFRAENMTQAEIILKSMFGFNDIVLPSKAFSSLVDNSGSLRIAEEGERWYRGSMDVIVYLVLAYAVCLTMPSSMTYFRRVQSSHPLRIKFIPNRKTAIFFAIIFLISLLMLSRVSEFLYFQF